jgi:hypothetical protein
MANNGDKMKKIGKSVQKLLVVTKMVKVIKKWPFVIPITKISIIKYVLYQNIPSTFLLK